MIVQKLGCYGISSAIFAVLLMQFGISLEKYPENGCKLHKILLSHDNIILSPLNVASVIKYGYVSSSTAMHRRYPG